ncbi:MAG: hypothetical protein M1821_000803 [Bathelium mastoideum]|nr:MAG: hypothetical protein M1821_000803 [Bathelium mastoideum]
MTSIKSTHSSANSPPRPSSVGRAAPPSIGSGYQVSIDSDGVESVRREKCSTTSPQVAERSSGRTDEKTLQDVHVIEGQPSSNFNRAVRPQLSSYNARVLRYVDALRHETNGPIEPGFMESSTLRNMNLVDLNNRLAKYQTIFLQQQTANEEDLGGLRKVLHDQAEAIRDMEYIRSLDYLTAAKKKERQDQSYATFPEYSDRKTGFDAFESRAYRTLRHSESSLPAYDSVRSVLNKLLPVSITWSNDEKPLKPELFKQKYQPTIMSDTVERISRFIVAMSGALFILVPMYIMAIHQSQTKNLVTTTVAVVLFAVSTSVALRMSNDQMLGATFAYAAVLMVFVGLTTQSNDLASSH